MRTLVLAWDAGDPGALDPVALRLARALSDDTTPVHLVAAAGGPSSTRAVDGVTVSWVAEAPPVLPADDDYDLSRVLALSSRAFATAERLQRTDPADAVVAIGWQTAYVAANLHATHGVPVVAVLPTIELTRRRGTLATEDAQLVHQIEWWLTYEARRVVTTSRPVRRELAQAFRLPPTKLEVVPPGADVPSVVGPPRADVQIVCPPDDPAAAAARAAADALASLGVDVLLERSATRGAPSTAAPARVVVVTDPDGAGTVVDAMASGRAVVVPERGPLRDLVHARRSGVRVDADDPAAITAAVRRLLTAPATAARLGEAARRRVRERHGWHDVAARYRRIVEHAVAEERLLRDQQRPRRPLRPALMSSPLLRLEPTD